MRLIDNTKALSSTGTVPLFRYVYIADSCDYEYEGKKCVEAYPEPKFGIPPVARFREGLVLRVGDELNYGSSTWYKITFEDEILNHPERLINNWFVSANDVEIIYTEGDESVLDLLKNFNSKRIIIDLSEQKLFAYDGEILFMEIPTSTGFGLAFTPIGEYEVLKKMPSRYMQGPNPYVISDFYDLPGVPWNLYFTTDGLVIHGTYWHESFGSPYSHGCVNISVEQSKILYDWAPIGTKVIVQE